MIVIVCMITTILPIRLFAAGSDVILNDNTGIPDKALYKAVLKALNKKSGTFTKAEAETVISLWAQKESDMQPDIKMLNGIGNLPNLELLYVQGNTLTNLSGIEELKKLRSLYVGDNKLTDISGIEKLTQLESLDLTDNKLSSLKGIENLTELSSLTAGGNKLKTLPDLTKLTQLEGHDSNTLFLFNKISEQEFRSKLPKGLLGNKAWLKQQIDFQIKKSLRLRHL